MKKSPKLNKFEQKFQMDQPRPPRVLAIAFASIAFSSIGVGVCMPIVALVLFFGLAGVATWLHRRGDAGNRNLVFYFMSALLVGMVFGTWYYQGVEFIR